MRILALDAALARCSVALSVDGVVVASRYVAAGRGQQAQLAPMLEAVLQALPGPVRLDAVAVTVGPGSFTGLRTALALAHGVASGSCPVIPVTVAEALAKAAGPLGGRTLWTAIDSRRGRVFLDIGGVLRPFEMSALPDPGGPVAVAGDAAIAVAAALAGRGFDVRLTDARLPWAADVAEMAALRLAGHLPPLAAQPLYVDAPEAKLPAGGLRPQPVA